MYGQYLKAGSPTRWVKPRVLKGRSLLCMISGIVLSEGEGLIVVEGLLDA